MAIDLSIIIPMYNTGIYIPNCIATINSQHLRIEIIIIDDGSDDNSCQIVYDIMENDSRITLIQTSNNGPGEARNIGMHVAKGKYILFIDSDDWISENALDNLYEKALKENLDIVVGNAFFYYGENNIKIRYIIPPFMLDRIYNGTDCLITMMDYGCFIPMVYCYLYKHDFLRENSLSFQKEKYEDELWTIQTICLAKKIGIIDYTFYYYRQRSGSIMNGGIVNNKKRDSLIVLTRNIISFCKNYSFEKNETLICWLYVKAAKMFYYSLLESIETNEFVDFYDNNIDIAALIISVQNKIVYRNAAYFYLYYLQNIIKVVKTYKL